MFELVPMKNLHAKMGPPPSVSLTLYAEVGRRINNCSAIVC
jgi:hypothetical protein